MRFVSHILGYQHGVRSETLERLGHDGKMVPPVRGLEAKFSHNLLTREDAFYLKSKIDRIPGTVEDENQREIDPTYRFSVFDSEIARLQEGWTEDEELLIVEALRASGRNGFDFVEIVPEPAAKPWPGYDDAELDTILAIVQAGGFDIDSVIRYELENRNAAAVINALEELKVQTDETVTVSA